MNPMSDAIERLRFAVRKLPGILSGFSEAESEQRPSTERWTKKEVIGHLIDSASNNHQRFVRGQIASGQDFPGPEPCRGPHRLGNAWASWSATATAGKRGGQGNSWGFNAGVGASLAKTGK